MLRNPLIYTDEFYLSSLFSIFKGFLVKERHVFGNLASVPLKASLGSFQAVCVAIHFCLLQNKVVQYARRGLELPFRIIMDCEYTKGQALVPFSREL